jgi:hypothetical protein
MKMFIFIFFKPSLLWGVDLVIYMAFTLFHGILMVSLKLSILSIPARLM